MGGAASTGREIQINHTRDGFRWALEKAHSDMSRLVAEGDEENASKEMCTGSRIKYLESEVINLKLAIEGQTCQYEKMERELQVEQNKVKRLMFGQLPYELLLDSPDQLEYSSSLLPRKFPITTFISCDVMNFSKLSSLLSPVDMVTLLDNIHVAVASAFSDESVYVVERSSERCLAVSGLVDYVEERNAKQTSADLPRLYATKLATAALKLLSNMSAVKVPKYPRSLLQLRVALHSGASQGGVVGLQNISLLQTPHYHVFGPAVDFTRYLAATGLPLQIRTSSVCHELLASDEAFLFERCPDFTAPNGDTIESYWLLDKKGLDVNLPSQFDALSLSECQDLFIF